jgi:hypothetical protein
MIGLRSRGGPENKESGRFLEKSGAKTFGRFRPVAVKSARPKLTLLLLVPDSQADWRRHYLAP